MRTRTILAALLVAGCAAVASAAAQDTVKVGMVLPMTGQLTSVGKQVAAGARLYMQQHGDEVAGKKIELIIRDDGGLPDTAKRIAQELLVNDKAQILGGGLTPSALAMAPLATQAKVPEVVVISGTSSVTERSPYIVRVSFTLGQSSGILGDWAAKNGSHKVVIIQSDWAPGAEATAVFSAHFQKAAARSSRPSRFRSPIRTSPPSCNVRAISRPIRCSCSCRRARPEPSPSSSSNAGWRSPASS
jgi:branched-chain amino acid transport system substrate-binding protein